MQDTPAIPDCLYAELRRLARACTTDNYKAVAERCDIAPHERFFGSLAKLLTAVNESQYSQGAPLLAAVVVNKKSGMPGPGFFRWARDHYPIQGTDREFWKSEHERVCAYWVDSDSSTTERTGRLPIQMTAKPTVPRSMSPMALVRSLFARL